MGKNKVLNLSTTKVETHCDLSSNRKRKGKKQKKPQEQEKRKNGPTGRSIDLATVFGQTNMGRVCFQGFWEDVGPRLSSPNVVPTGCIRLATSSNTVQHRPTMLDGWCFNRLAGPLS